MKLLTISGQYYAKSTGKGYDEADFDVQCAYPFDISMDESQAEIIKRQRAFMFIKNFFAEDLLKESLKKKGELKNYAGRFRNCQITDVEDISSTEIKKPEFKYLREAISHKKGNKEVIIKASELSYEDVMAFTKTSQIIFTFMSFTNPNFEDTTNYVARNLTELKTGEFAKKQQILIKFLGLEPAKQQVVHQELSSDIEDVLDVAPKKEAKSDEVSLDELEKAAKVSNK